MEQIQQCYEFNLYLIKHLEEHRISYFKHMIKALSISSIMLTGSILCFIHAFLPFLFVKSASERIITLYKKLSKGIGIYYDDLSDKEIEKIIEDIKFSNERQ